VTDKQTEHIDTNNEQSELKESILRTGFGSELRNSAHTFEDVDDLLKRLSSHFMLTAWDVDKAWGNSFTDYRNETTFGTREMSGSATNGTKEGNNGTGN
jgi:hypothetical protein